MTGVVCFSSIIILDRDLYELTILVMINNMNYNPGHNDYTLFMFMIIELINECVCIQ